MKYPKSQSNGNLHFRLECGLNCEKITVDCIPGNQAIQLNTQSDIAAPRTARGARPDVPFLFESRRELKGAISGIEMWPRFDLTHMQYCRGAMSDFSSAGPVPRMPIGSPCNREGST